MSVGMAWSAGMPSRRAVGLVALVLVVAVVVLAGCTPGGGSTPTGTSSVTTPSTSSVFPTATPAGTTNTVTGSRTAQPYPSDVPVTARQHTDAGAEAFVRHWFGVLNKAWTGPTAGLLTAISVPSCKSCAQYEGATVDLVSARQRFVGDPAVLGTVSILDLTAEGATVLTQLNQESRTVLDSTGAVVRTQMAKQLSLQLRLAWESDHWLMAETFVVRSAT